MPPSHATQPGLPLKSAAYGARLVEQLTAARWPGCVGAAEKTIQCPAVWQLPRICSLAAGSSLLVAMWARAQIRLIATCRPGMPQLMTEDCDPHRVSPVSQKPGFGRASCRARARASWRAERVARALRCRASPTNAAGDDSPPAPQFALESPRISSVALAGRARQRASLASHRRSHYVRTHQGISKNKPRFEI